MGAPIYVEITISAPLDRLWALTQTPDLHEKWDLRFSRIDYLPRPDPVQPQRFTYQTRIGFGMVIAGTGESVGERRTSGDRTSALRFASDDPKSLILEGSGYWKYQPVGGSVRFLTLYDYRTRFGVAGRLFDTLVFRPLIGWATAWSFDRLRLWLERGIDPGLSAARAVTDAICRLSLALCWAYQGAVPKLLARDPSELALTADTLPGALKHHAATLSLVAGMAELVIAACFVIGWGRRWPFVLSLVVVVAVTIPAVFAAPAILLRAFNPASLVLAMAALSACGLVACKDLPSARRCLRRKPKESA